MNKLVILFLVFAVLGSIEAYKKVAFEDIPHLDLYRGRYTTGNKPTLQQLCVEDGHSECAYYAPDYVHCVNTGKGERGQVTWDCQAKFKANKKFEHIRVFCETYPGTQPSEGYVIDGSCALRYILRTA